MRWWVSDAANECEEEPATITDRDSAGFAGSAIVCSGHGQCTSDGNFQCICNVGFTGYDCSKPMCPTGRAWVEEPQVDNVAHLNLVQCSNAACLSCCIQIGQLRCN